MGMLYTKETINGIELKNRWIMLAVHTGYADPDGSFGKRDLEFFKRRAAGGAAAITLVGGVSVVGSTFGMHYLYDDKYCDGIKMLVDEIHLNDCKVFMQLYHSGRNNTFALHNMQPIAPSAIASPLYKDVPKEMTEEDIEITIKQFKDAALRCRNCGVDGVEVSASVGYLLSEFLSPRTNIREDEWGGSDEKRFRFPTKVLTEIRDAVGPDYPILVKISGGDMLGGYDNQYMVDFLNQLPKGTVDAVTVTGGWHEAPVPQISYHVKPGGFAYLAKEIKEGTGLKVIACNRINSDEIAEELLENGYCDFVGSARNFLADPDFVNKSINHIPYNRCQGCNRGCIERSLKRKDVCCVFNPETGKEYLEFKKADGSRERLLVIGGGPTGIEAAKLGCDKGWNVTLVTEESELGGKLKVASKPLFKHGFTDFVEVKKYELEKYGADILTDTRCDKEVIKSIAPDRVIIATGSKPFGFEAFGNSGILRVNAGEVLMSDGRIDANDIVVIGGGSVGLETAELVKNNYPEKNVTVIEMAEKAGNGLGGLKWIMMKHLKELGVKIETSSGIGSISENSVVIEKQTEEGIDKKEIKCDGIIVATGYKPYVPEDIVSYLEDNNIPYLIAGDANGKGNIFDGLAELYEEMRKM